MLAKLVGLLLCFWAEGASSAKILALMVVASRSHHMWNSKYLEALVERGHHVTYFGVDEYKNPPGNLSHILVKGVYESFGGSFDLTSLSDVSPWRSTLFLEEWDAFEAEHIVESEAMKELVRLVRREKFDLVIHDVGSGAFLLGVVDVLGGAPVVGITAFGVPPWTLGILGNPTAYSSNPHFYLPYSDAMTLFQRANNYFLHLFSFAVRWFYMRNHDEYSRKCFGSGVRPLHQILDEFNIIMVNSNPMADYPFPKVPGLVPVGGLHIRRPRPLPRELKTFLDEAEAGVVYFSLGTNIKSTLTEEKIGILMKAFKEIAPVRVLWKSDLDFFPGQPESVRTEMWLPQNDVLAHPNVRVFFTHSGLLSTQEAVYHGKPIVGMPFFLDQNSNLMKCLEKGFAEKLVYTSLTAEGTALTLRKVLEEPRYLENARKASAIFRDEQEHPLERALYWTEYAIRHKGAPHLRHATRNLSWFQNWMLDVLVLTAGFCSALSFFTYRMTKAILSRIRRGGASKLKAN